MLTSARKPFIEGTEDSAFVINNTEEDEGRPIALQKRTGGYQQLAAQGESFHNMFAVPPDLRDQEHRQAEILPRTSTMDRITRARLEIEANKKKVKLPSRGTRSNVFEGR